jgi:hypothetical protein
MKKGRSGVAALADFFTRHFGFRLAAMRGRDALEPFMSASSSKTNPPPPPRMAN